MAREQLTLFTWGYKGWGNATEKFVAAADAVEQSRGWGQPLFVDVRASRKVRAIGFRERAFEKLLGERYRWMNGLGNEAINEGGAMRLIAPGAASDLLSLAQKMLSERRRIIFFCACESPSRSCHRHMVADELLAAAEQGGHPIAVMEWPGIESIPKVPELLRLDASTIRRLRKAPGSIPLGTELPDIRWLAQPWFSVIRFEAPKLPNYIDKGVIYSGPAQYSIRGWALPFLGAEVKEAKALKLSRARMEECFVLPRSASSAHAAS